LVKGVDMGFMQANIGIYWATLKEATAYRVTMLLSLITGPLVVLVNYFVWQAIYTGSGKAVLGGFTLDQMITYIVISQITWYLIWDDTEDELKNGVKEGTFTMYLLKPLSFMRFAFVKKIGHRTWAFFLEFIPVILILGFMLSFQIYKNGNIFWYAATLLLGFVTLFLVNMLLGLLAFWFVRPNGIIWIYRMVGRFLYGGFLPLSIFPHSVQKVFFFLPFQFVNYVPAQAFIGRYELAGITLTPTGILLYGVLQVAILFLIVLVCWRISVRKYCGVGT
jgi:ABC-2 type transport system permease protein